MRRKLKIWIVAVVLLGTVAAQAQDGQWSWKVTPYMWLAGMKGDVGVGPVSSSLDWSSSDVLNDLSFAAMVSLDANNGTWGVLGDVFYVNLDDGVDTILGRIDTGIEQWIVTAVPYYRVLSKEGLTLDLGVGGRYMDTAVDLATPIASRSESKNWLDPIVLARLRIPITEKFSLNFTGDIGGFEVDSNFTWQLLAAAGYSVTKQVDLLLGYRHFEVDYEKGDFSYDMATSGFALGASLSF